MATYSNGQLEFTYAPFTAGFIRPFNSNDVFQQFGKLEENSKIGLAEIIAGKDEDQRLLGSKIRIECLDLEPRQDEEYRFLKYMNQEVQFIGELGKGAYFVAAPVRYYFVYDPLPQRGFRWKHVLTGIDIWPNVVFRKDKGYSEIRNMLVGSIRNGGGLGLGGK